MSRFELPLPQAEDLATCLGLNTSGETLSELQKMSCIDSMIHRICEEPEPHRDDIILSHFCALYLPAVVERLFDLPNHPPARPLVNEDDLPAAELWPLLNPYRTVLTHLQHLPYFYKYLRSSHPSAHRARALPELIAARLADLAPRFESPQMLHHRLELVREFYVDLIAQICQFLCTLLLAYSKDKDRKDVVSEPTKRTLIPYLRQWLRRYPAQNFTGPPTVELGHTAMRVLLYLTDESSFVAETQPIRKRQKGLGVCGLPTCHVTGTTKLKAYGRCQTVAYCSPEHQRAHWSAKSGLGPGHKEFCHKTEY